MKDGIFMVVLSSSVDMPRWIFSRRLRLSGSWFYGFFLIDMTLIPFSYDHSEFMGALLISSCVIHSNILVVVPTVLVVALKYCHYKTSVLQGWHGEYIMP